MPVLRAQSRRVRSARSRPPRLFGDNQKIVAAGVGLGKGDQSSSESRKAKSTWLDGGTGARGESNGIAPRANRLPLGQTILRVLMPVPCPMLSPVCRVVEQLRSDAAGVPLLSSKRSGSDRSSLRRDKPWRMAGPWAVKRPATGRIGWMLLDGVVNSSPSKTTTMAAWVAGAANAARQIAGRFR